MVIDWDLQEDLEREVANVRDSVREKIATDSVQTEIIENLHGRGRSRGFSFDYDEPTYVAGGQNLGPRPLEYFLAGWAFCQQVQYVRQALLSGVDFDSLEMDVAGDVNIRSILEEEEGGVPAGFVNDELRMKTRIEGDSNPSKILELVRRAQAHCHAHATLQREMTLRSDVQYNGEPLEI